MVALIQKFIAVSFPLLSAVICFAQKTTTLSGTIDGLDAGSKVYLSQTARAGKLDSISVTSDSFLFKINVEKGDVYFFDFTVEKQEFGWAVYLQNGSDVHVSITKNLKQTTFTGSKLAEEQNDFINGLYPFYNRDSALDHQLVNARDSNLITKLKVDKENVNSKRQAYYESYVRSHRNSPFSVAVIYLYMQETPLPTLEALYDSLSGQAKANNLVTQIIPYYFAKLKNDVQFKVGEQLKDFVLNDTSGKAHSFFSLKGNDYVLLDFWASWCGPCRKSTPVIKELLQTYHLQNFKVISVSADKDKEKWKAAIVKDKMNWYHLSDLKGPDSGFMLEKYIFSFPTYILISPEGVILTKPATLERVKEELVHVFESKNKNNF